jgi:hypothetical protein
MCFNPSPERRVPSPDRYMAFAKFCFWRPGEQGVKEVMHNNTWGWANGEQVNSRQNKSTVVRHPPEVGTSKTYLTDVQ